MAVDKLVDSTQLDADLTSVANAIRTKGGTSADLAFPSGFVSAVQAISGGGDAHPIYYEQFTLTGDTTIRSLIDAAQYAIHSQNCIILIRSNGTTAPASGSYSLNNFMVLIINGQVYYNQTRYFYATGKVAPDSVVAHPLWGRENNNAISVTNGVLTSNNTSTSCIGSTGALVTLCEFTLDSDWLDIVLGQKSV